MNLYTRLFLSLTRMQLFVKEKPEALLPTMGGQTGLNIAKTLSEVLY